MRSFGVRSVLQMTNKFGKKCANLSLIFAVLIAGEIERQFIWQMVCAGNFWFGKQSLVK
jgi:hypothetical protein